MYAHTNTHPLFLNRAWGMFLYQLQSLLEQEG
jgi:hypothetical protein